MPQSQGPVVIQNPARQNVFGGILGQALGGVAQGVAGAAGRFLGDMIYEDPQAAYYRVNADNAKAKRFSDAQENYQKWLAAGGPDRQNTPQNRAMFAKLFKMNEEEAAAFDTVASYTDTTSSLMQKSNKWATEMGDLSDYEDPTQTQQATQAPFTAGGGLSASVPPPPKVEEPKQDTTTAPITAATIGAPSPTPSPMPSATNSVVNLQEENASPLTPPAPSAQAESLQKEKEAAEPTVEPAKPVPAAEATDPTPAPPVKPVAPLTPQEAEKRRALANLAFTRVRGTMAQLGQIRLANQTGNVDPKAVAMATAMVQATDHDINMLAEQGRVLQGLPPDPSVNYADAAHKLAAYQVSQDPVKMEQLSKAGWDVSKIKAAGQQWLSTAEKLNPAAMLMVGQFLPMFQFDPANQSTLNYTLGKESHQIERERLAEAARQANIQFSQNERTLDMKERELSSRLGIDAATLKGMQLNNSLKESLMGEEADLFRTKVAIAKQELDQNGKKFGVAMTAGELANMSAYAALADKEQESFFKFAAAQDTRINAQANKWAESQIKVATARSNFIKAEKSSPSVINGDAAVAGMDEKRVAEIARKQPAAYQGMLASIAADASHPTATEMAQAAVGVTNPGYGAYLSQLRTYDKMSDKFGELIANVAAQQDKGLSAIMQEYQSAMADPKKMGMASVHRQTRDRMLQTWVQSNFVDVTRTRTIDAVKQMDTPAATEFFAHNPDKLDVLLGNVVADGKGSIVTNPGNLTDRQKRGLFILARNGGAAMTAEQFANLAVPGKGGGPATTLGKAFGKSTKEAYNAYVKFHNVVGSNGT